MDTSDFDAERIQFLIDAGEDDKTEFKETVDLSRKNKPARAEFVRDTLALANSHGSRAGFLIIGVENDSKKIVGIEPGFYDDAEFQAIFESFIAPPLDAQFREIQLGDATVGVLGVRPRGLRPYLVKRDYSDGSSTLLVQGQVWIRAGSKKRLPTPYDTELYFSEYAEQTRQRAELVISWSLADGYLDASVKSTKRLKIDLRLENRGNGIAHFPAIDVIVPERMSLDSYGVDGNRNLGLEKRPLRRSGGNPRRHLFAAGAETVIHPGAELAVVRFDYMMHEPETCHEIELIAKVYCEGFQLDQVIRIQTREFRSILGLDPL